MMRCVGLRVKLLQCKPNRSRNLDNCYNHLSRLIRFTSRHGTHASTLPYQEHVDLHFFAVSDEFSG
jgi:hypothetical protein